MGYWKEFYLESAHRNIRANRFKVRIRDCETADFYLSKEMVLFPVADWAYIFPSSNIRGMVKKYIPSMCIFEVDKGQWPKAINIYDLFVLMRRLKGPDSDGVFREMLHKFHDGEFECDKFSQCIDVGHWIHRNEYVDGIKWD